jgi:integrase
MLLEAPSNYVKRFPDMTLPQAIKANKQRATPFPVLNVRTINDKYLGKLHAILNWCVKNDLIPDNPAAGQKVENAKATKPTRVNFLPDDLARIFGEKFTRPFTEDQWAMLVALFSGMRASEEGQLKLDSIRHERGVLVFVVEEDTKTLGSQRLIPVHSKLIELGLEERIDELRRKGVTHLFPKWQAAAERAEREAAAKGGIRMINQFYPRFIPRRFNVTYKAAIGIHDKRKVWHSFRHTFKTGLARAGVVKSIRDELAGHDDNSAGAGYVHDTSIETLKGAVDKLQFDGFSLN